MIWENTRWINCCYSVVSLDQYVILRGILDPGGQPNAFKGCTTLSQLLSPPLQWSSFCCKECASSLISLSCLFSRSFVFSLVAFLLVMDWLTCTFPHLIFLDLHVHVSCVWNYTKAGFRAVELLWDSWPNAIHYCHRCWLFYYVPSLNIKSTYNFLQIIPWFTSRPKVFSDKQISRNS